MANSKRLSTVRAAIEGYLASQADQAGCEIVTESILIRDEHYCGRRFTTSTHQAVWFIEEDQVKIYAADRSLCCVMSADEIDSAAEQAENSPPQIISIHSKQNDSDGRDLSDGDEEYRRAA